MSRVCDVSGIGPMFGGTRQHNRGAAGGTDGPWAFKATRKPHKWKPNLRKVKVLIDGKMEKINILMRYYKKLRKEGKVFMKTRGVYAVMPAKTQSK